MTTPRLTPSVVTTDGLLAAAIASVIEADDEDRQHREGIARLQGELRALVSDEAWQVYLLIEAAVAVRIADLAVTLTCWGFVEGQRDAARGDVR